MSGGFKSYCPVAPRLGWVFDASREKVGKKRNNESPDVVWDETKVLDAKVGEYVVIARRSGEKWFLGAITNNTGRELEVDLSFLPENKKLHLTYFEDGINADRQAMDYKKKETEVTSSTKLTMKLVRNGGWTGVIE